MMNIRLAQMVLSVIEDRLTIDRKLGLITTKQEEQELKQKLWEMVFPEEDTQEEQKK